MTKKKSSVDKVEIIYVKNCTIKSVEKGSFYTNPKDPVVAFTVEVNKTSKPVKAILKGDLAYLVYGTFLDNLKSKDRIIEDESGIDLKKEVVVSFKGTVKEDRAKELVVDNVTDLVFDFTYSVIDNG